jgi:hypothetical protein
VAVAFDAATDVGELGGDGVVSLSHTSTGSNRGVCAFANTSDGGPPQITGVTYAGAAMSQIWDETDGSFIRSHGFQLVNQSSSAGATVTATWEDIGDQAYLAVISMTGVHQTVPVGTHTASGTNTATPSVTVGSVTADGMVVDGVIAGDGIAEASSAAGANQTTRTEEVVNNTYFGTSTQAASDGGVMSWALTGTPSFGTLLVGVEFKAAAVAAGGAKTRGIHSSSIVGNGIGISV